MERETQTETVSKQLATTQLIFNPGVIKEIITHLEQSFPKEGCGFIFGQQKGRNKFATEVWTLENVSNENQKRRYAINPLSYIKAEQHAIDQGLILLGIYHSHPNHPAIPSLTDLQKAVPVFSYAILSIQNGAFENIISWVLSDDSQQFEREVIVPKNILN